MLTTKFFRSNLTFGLKQIRFRRFATASQQVEYSDLHQIKTNHKDPMKLFNEWYTDYVTNNKDDPIFRVCCVSTASKNGDVSSRNLLLRRIDQDGFVIMTDNRSHKSKNLTENPQASLVFLWNKFIDDLLLTRQVRVYGRVQQLGEEHAAELFRKEPAFAKIRAFICPQGTQVTWDALKKHHDDVFEKLRNDADLQKPDHVVSYKIFPQYLEFYETFGKKIADRLLYQKDDSSSWNISRLAA